jgi:hypothetical protein
MTGWPLWLAELRKLCRRYALPPHSKLAIWALVGPASPRRRPRVCTATPGHALGESGPTQATAPLWLLSADKRSQLAQLALLWSTASCANWMQVWRKCYAGELDS